MMRLNRIVCSLVMILAPAFSSAQDWPSLWKNYSAGFLDNQIRVIDHDDGDRTTSEGQSYAMFFALVANDRQRFDRLLHWTELNLASGDLTQHLPAWSWGKARNGKWGVIDANSASDADLWIAYSLLEAGAAWNEPHYTWLGTALAKRIASQEVTQIPGFGTMLLPGPQGFHTRDAYRLNASYVPLQLVLRLGHLLPDGPWQEIAAHIPALIRGSSRNGFISDWTDFKLGAGLVPSSMASFDAIRVYLWAGMLDPETRDRDLILKSMQGMARVLHTSAVPPAKVKSDATIEDSRGPVGFSAALLPYLAALGENNLENEQMSRLQAEFNPKNGLYGNPPRYYDQNLALFALGWKSHQFWFDSDGALKTSWENTQRAR